MIDSLEAVKEAQAFCEAAAIRYGIDVTRIRGHERAGKPFQARRSVMREMADAGWSYAAIGRAINRHHATVMHGLGLLR